MSGSQSVTTLLGMACLSVVLWSAAALGAETVDVALTKARITAKSTTLDHGDVLNICSRDEAFHQPYSLASPNKFGSSKAREKDILAKNQCRIVEVKNTGKQPVEMTLYDRFVPAAYLTFKIAPKPAAKSSPKSDAKAEGKAAAEKPQHPDTFGEPMQGNKRLAYCYGPDEGCGEKAASAWCRGKGYKGAKKWEKETSGAGGPKAGAYLGSDLSCKKGDCEVFSWITCRTGPPTFF